MKKSGVLIRSLDGFIFRQYTKDGNFVDYTIIHGDLAITIEDATAIEIKNDKGENFIEYNDDLINQLKRGW